MAYISFEHKNNIENAWKRGLFQAGVGGDFIHCEIVLSEYGNYVCSSWNPKGVQIRPWTEKKDETLWENFILGSCDKELFDFFYDKQGVEYTISGLVVNMKFNAGVKSNKSFCSQICLDALKAVKHFDNVLPDVKSSTISPNDLYNIIKSNNFINTKNFQPWH